MLYPDHEIRRQLVRERHAELQREAAVARIERQLIPAPAPEPKQPRRVLRRRPRFA